MILKLGNKMRTIEMDKSASFDIDGFLDDLSQAGRAYWKGLNDAEQSKWIFDCNCDATELRLQVEDEAAPNYDGRG